jgi:hypothetical protein
MLVILQKLFNQIKEDEIDRTCSTYGEVRNAYKILIGREQATCET